MQLKLAEAVQKYKSVVSFCTASPLQIYFINIIMLYCLIFFLSVSLLILMQLAVLGQPVAFVVLSKDYLQH